MSNKMFLLSTGLNFSFLFHLHYESVIHPQPPCLFLSVISMSIVLKPH